MLVCSDVNASCFGLKRGKLVPTAVPFCMYTDAKHQQDSDMGDIVECITD